MKFIHYSGVPGSGKTSLCLSESKQNLIEGNRVFWISGNRLDPDRFSQIMNDLSISNASKFHLIMFEPEEIKFSFQKIITQVINMSKQLTTTKLIVFDDWDYDMDAYEKVNRIESISEMVESSKNNSISVIITSLAYESHNNELNKFTARAGNELEKIGFKNSIVCNSEGGFKSIINSDKTINFKITNNGIEFL